MARWCGFGLCLLAATVSPEARAQSSPELSPRDRALLAESMRIASGVRAGVWSGWEQAAMAVLLVTDSVEYLMGHPRPTPEFARGEPDVVLGPVVWTRPRRLSPNLLATFPAVGGVPTIVIGSADRTGRAATPWVLTVLHEHFHQWQQLRPDYYEGVDRLDLAAGDSTGRWMLDYPFPYDSAPVQRALRRLARDVVRALGAPADRRLEAVNAAVDSRTGLRRLLSPADYRYFEFQLWQEGVARFIEYAVARAAADAGPPLEPFLTQPDYTPYCAEADRAYRRLRRDLEQLDLGRERRLAFYPLGAAIALLLEETDPGWRRTYLERPFVLASLLKSGTP